jgi:hypothetical protein
MSDNITINYQPCESSQIAEWGYDADTGTLGLKFHGTGKSEPAEYQYGDVPPEIAAGFATAESVGKYFGANIRGKFAYAKQPDSRGIVFGLPQSQEPKYTVSRKDGRLVNRSTGIAIPDDEPVFVLRAKDRNARGALDAYMGACTSANHRAVVKSRMLDFEAFASAHPERMKEPDSSLQDQAVNVERRFAT